MTAVAVAFASLVAVAPAQAAVPDAVVSGTVTDAAGEVAGADVSVLNASGAVVGNSDVTDAHGDYSVTGLSASTGAGYTVYVEPHNGDAATYLGNKYTQDAATVFTLAASAKVTGKDVIVPAGATVSGTISDSLGPVAGAVVTALDADGNSYGIPSTTDATGAYSIGALPPISLTLSVAPAGTPPADAPGWLGSAADQADAAYLSLTVGQSVAHQDVTLVRGGFISGTVTDGSGPVANAVVTVIADNGDGDQAGTDTTDLSGHYDVGGLAAGTYAVNVDPASDADAEQTATGIVVTVGDTTAKDFTLAPASSIAGTVKNSSNAAIVGASVLAFDAASGDQVGSTVKTAADGSYKIGGLPAGDYLLEVIPPTAGGYALQWWQNKTTQATAQQIAVAASTNVTAKNFVLTAGGSITGKVTDGPSHPVQGVVVTVLDGSGNPIGASDTTDPNGNYTITGVPAGTYQLSLDPGDSGDLPSTITGVVVANGAATTKNATLTVGGTISGIVTDAAGPVIGVVVHVTDGDGADVAVSDPTGASGSYQVNGLPLGTYYVEAVPGPGNDAQQWLGGKTTQTGSTPVAITTGGQLVTSQNFLLASGGTIKGTVTDAHGAVAGAAVTVTDGVGATVGNPTTTAADGGYQIDGIPAGSSYSVDIAPVGNDLESISTGIAVTVAHVTPLDVVLTVGATISGTVTGPGGAVVGATVTAYDSDGDDFGAPGVTSSSGAYTITALPAGSYTLQVVPADGATVAQQWLGGVSSQATATYLTVTTAQIVTGKNFTLVSGGTVSGTVTDSHGAVVGATVTVVATGDAVLGTATTDSSGHYTIPGVAAGTGYTVKVDPADGSDDLSGSHALAAVTAGGTTAQDVTLLVGGSISGVIHDADGPVAGVTVYAVDATQNDIASSAVTGADGAYRIGGLPFGGSNYWLRAVPSTGDDATSWYVSTGSAATQADGTSIAITTAGQGVTGKDITLISGGIVAGTVTDADGPVQHATVTVYNATTSLDDSSWTADTDAGGHYSIAGVPEGSDYSIDIAPPLASRDLEQTVTGVNVATGTTTTRDVLLAAGGTISGTIAGDGTHSVAGAIVHAFDASSDDIADSAAVGAGGAYSIVGLPAGQYWLEAVPAPASPYALQWLGGFTVQPGSTSVTIAAPGDSTGGHDFTLTSAGAITGHVKAAGAGVNGVTVTVLDASGAQVGTTTTVTDGGGAGGYTISGLAAGTYSVEVDPGSTGDLPAVQTGVVVSAGASTTQNITLDVGASISGTVHGAGAAPLAGAVVSAVDDSGSIVASSDPTGADGHYTIIGLPFGAGVSYWLQAVPADGSGYALQWLGGSPAQAGSTAVAATSAGQSITGKDFTLISGGTLSGIVSDSHGPVVGAEVSVLDSHGAEVGAGATTGIDGHYTISGLPAGTYSVEADPAGNDLTATVAGVIVTVGETTTANITVTVGASISGTVRDSHGVVAGVGVSAFDSDGDSFGNAATTDASGNYTVNALPAGHYTLQFTPPLGSASAPQWLGGASDQSGAIYVDVATGQALTGKDATLLAGGTIAGTVTGTAGRSFGPAAAVTVADSTGNTVGSAALPAGQTSFAYSVGGLASGSYTVTVDPDDGDQIWNSPSAVSVSSGATSTVDVTLVAGAVVTGKLTDAGSGAPVKDADVQVVTDDGTTVDDATSIADGTYAVKGIAPGAKYTLQVQPVDGHAPQWWHGVPTQDTATYFALAAGQTAPNFNFSLAPGTGVVGTVIASNGQPAVNADVQLYDSDGDQIADGTTDDSGDYVVGGQLPGTYTVEVVPDSSTAGTALVAAGATDAVQWWGGASDIGHAHFQSLAAGAPATVNFTLVPGTTFTGTVTGSNGQPAVGASISLEDAQQNDTISVTAGTDGSYALYGVPAGSWTLDVSPATPDDGTDDGTDDGDDEDSGPDLSQDLDPTNDGDLEQWLSDSNAYFFSDAKFVSTSGGASIPASFQLHEPGILVGKVLSVSKKAVANADVDIVSAHGDDINDATTSGSGGYRLTMLPPGSYKLTITPSDSSHAKRVFTVAVTAGAVTKKNFTVLNAFKTKSKPAVVLAAVGKKAYVAMKPWSPKATKFSYQWMLGGKPIKKATHPTFTATKKMLGKKLSVVVTGSAKNYAPTPVTSAAVVIKKGFTTSPAPKISGKPVVGSVLTATNGKWKPKATKLSFQWFAGGTKISKATHATFKVTKKQLKLKITVVVTATKSGYAPTPITSKPTHAVKPAPKTKPKK